MKLNYTVAQKLVKTCSPYFFSMQLHQTFEYHYKVLYTVTGTPYPLILIVNFFCIKALFLLMLKSCWGLDVLLHVSLKFHDTSSFCHLFQNLVERGHRQHHRASSLCVTSFCCPPHALSCPAPAPLLPSAVTALIVFTVGLTSAADTQRGGVTKISDTCPHVHAPVSVLCSLI